MSKLITVSLAILALVALTKAEKVSIGIVHYNDIYGELFPFEKNSQPPKMCSADKKTKEALCVGGVRELAGHVKNIKESFNNDYNIGDQSQLVIATGNLISGENGWLPLLNDPFSWKEHGKLIKGRAYDLTYINHYKPNFTALGPREFDGGIQLLNTYLVDNNRVTRPIASNVNCENAKLIEEMELCSVIDSFQFANVGGNYKIGLIGFVDPKVVHLSNPGSLEFYNTIDSLKSVVESYLQDTKTIIAIGSGSLELVKSIADQIEKVKLVIYANGDDKTQSGEYPLRHNGKFIAKAGMYGSSVGKLIMDIETTTGDVVLNADSKLVEVDNSVDPGDAINNTDDYWNSEFEGSYDGFEKQIKDLDKKLSKTKVNINGAKESCWNAECTLGDLVADAMVNCAYQDKSLSIPANLIAVWHSGGLGNVKLLKGDDITTVGVNKMLPYSSNGTLVTVTGATLKQMFMQSATALNNDSFQWGQFLQVSSGLEVHYGIVDGKYTVDNLRAIRMDTKTNKLRFEEVQDAFIYDMIIPSDLYYGRNAYWDLPGSFISGSGYADHASIGAAHICLRNYVGNVGTMKLGLQNRVFIDTN